MKLVNLKSNVCIDRMPNDQLPGFNKYRDYIDEQCGFDEALKRAAPVAVE